VIGQRQVRFENWEWKVAEENVRNVAYHLSSDVGWTIRYKQVQLPFQCYNIKNLLHLDM
jgi:hypothetical protein